MNEEQKPGGRNVGLSAGVELLPLPKVYTVSRCRSDDTLYGPVHWSADATVTFCGADLSVNSWWILSNDFSGDANCRKCRRISSRAECAGYEPLPMTHEPEGGA